MPFISLEARKKQRLNSKGHWAFSPSRTFNRQTPACFDGSNGPAERDDEQSSVRPVAGRGAAPALGRFSVSAAAEPACRERRLRTRHHALSSTAALHPVITRTRF